MEENQYTPVTPGEFVLSADQGGDYVQIPHGEPLEAHISRIEKVRAKKYGTEEMEDKLSIGFKIDQDVEGQGQVYTSWFRPSLNSKASLTKVMVAIYPDEIPQTVDITELLGMPLRVTLTKGAEKNGKVRQYVETFLKPTKSQKKVEVEASMTPDDLDSMSELNVDDIFPE